MFRHPDLHEALDARRRAAALYLFDPNVMLVDVGWRILQSEGRIDRRDLRVRVHKRRKPRGAEYESFREANPQRDVSEDKVGFKVDIVEAPYKLHSSLGFFFPPVSTPAPPTPAPLAGPGVMTEILPRRGRYRPLRGGCSGIRQYGTAATLGGFVTDRATGAKMALSNYHVLAGSNALPGLPIVQPSPSDSGWSQYTVATYTRDAMLDSMDAAVAKLSPGVDCVNNQIGLGPVTGLGTPEQDMFITKSGRTTGVTEAQISGFEGEGVLMNYGGFRTVIRNVWHITSTGGPTSAGGDSGSWWLERDSHQVVALHFAGYHAADDDYSLAISMPKILDALKVDLAL